MGTTKIATKIATIDLDIKNAELFKIFCKYSHYDRWAEVWQRAEGLNPGSLIFHFDKDNKIRKHELHFFESVKPKTRLKIMM